MKTYIEWKTRQFESGVLRWLLLYPVTVSMELDQSERTALLTTEYKRRWQAACNEREQGECRLAEPAEGKCRRSSTKTFESSYFHFTGNRKILNIVIL